MMALDCGQYQQLGVLYVVTGVNIIVQVRDGSFCGRNFFLLNHRKLTLAHSIAVDDEFPWQSIVVMTTPCLESRDDHVYEVDNGLNRLLRLVVRELRPKAGRPLSEVVISVSHKCCNAWCSIESFWTRMRLDQISAELSTHMRQRSCKTYNIHAHDTSSVIKNGTFVTLAKHVIHRVL